MFYTIYKITNKVNNKFYIGKHKTKKINDNYMGSGKLIKAAIAKYGIQNFHKEILYIFDSENEMNEMERKLVVLHENSYNLCSGGNGGFDYINRSGILKFKNKKHKNHTKKKISRSMIGNKNGLGNQGGKKNLGKKRELLECPHCNRKIAINMYARYHGEKCKSTV